MAWLFSRSGASQETRYTGIALQTSARGVTIPVVYGTNRVGTNLLWYGDFKSSRQSVGGKGGVAGGKGAGTYTYSSSVALGLCEGPIQAIGRVWASNDVTNLATLGATLFTGTVPQSPWGYLTSKHPTEAVPYSGIAYLGITTYNLGSSSQLPNHNFEVCGRLARSAFSDADPSAVIPDILTNAQYGIGLPLSRIGELRAVSTVFAIPTSGATAIIVGSGDYHQNLCVTLGTTRLSSGITPVTVTYSVVVDDALGHATYTFSDALRGTSVTIEWVQRVGLVTYTNYVNALGLYVSPMYTSQTAVESVLTDIMRITNSVVVWSGGILSILPYATSSAAGNGYTYTHNSTPVAFLGEGDVLDTGDEPVRVSRKRMADSNNIVHLEYANRQNNYNRDVVTVYNEPEIHINGRRELPQVSTSMVTNRVVASVVADLILLRESIRNTYVVQVDIRYSTLSCMDIIRLTMPTHSLDVIVRITEITERSGELQITAEDYVDNAIGSAPVDVDYGSGYTFAYSVSPGTISAYSVYEPPSPLRTSASKPEVWLFAAGVDAHYGGCEVWLSYDNVSFTKVGEISGSSIIGVTQTSITTTTDPYTSTVNVNLAVSNGSLLGGSTADADAGVTLSLIDSELVAYSTATLVSAHVYAMQTYIRRGKYGTQKSTHAVGATFVRCNDVKFVTTYAIDDVGKTVYVKLRPFNMMHGGMPDLSTCAAVTYVLGSTTSLGAPTVTAYRSGSVTVVNWTAVSGASGYSIYYGPTTGSFATATLLGSVGATYQYVTSSIPAGTQRVYVIAVFGSSQGTPGYIDIT